MPMGSHARGSNPHARAFRRRPRATRASSPKARSSGPGRRPDRRCRGARRRGARAPGRRRGGPPPARRRAGPPLRRGPGAPRGAARPAHPAAQPRALPGPPEPRAGHHRLDPHERRGARARASTLDRAALGEERRASSSRRSPARLVEVVAAGDTVARLEDDEFAIVTEGIVDESEGIALAERLVGAFDRPFLVGGVPTAAQVSVGVVVTKDNHSEAAAVLVEAEDALAPRPRARPGQLRADRRRRARPRRRRPARRGRAARRRRARRAARLLPAALHAGRRPPVRRRGAGPLGAPAARPAAARRVPAAGRAAPRPDRRDRRVVLGEACAQAVTWPEPEPTASRCS